MSNAIYNIFVGMRVRCHYSHDCARSGRFFIDKLFADMASMNKPGSVELHFRHCPLIL